MTTYLILNVLFLLTLIMFIPKDFKKPGKAWWLTLAGLFVLTAVFDPLLVFFHIYGYTSTKILGIRLLGAPIEDFFYALYAACIVPMIWNRLGEKGEDTNAKSRR